MTVQKCPGKEDRAGGMTQVEVAKALGISQRAVSWIETAALEKLRREFKKVGIDEEDAMMVLLRYG